MNATVHLADAGNGTRLLRPANGVFVHADDMGATPSMTARLCDAWESGLLDSFSVFGDCDHPEAISARLAALPDRPARISVHLNLGEGRPITPAPRVARLVDRAGFFNAEFVGMLSRHLARSTTKERNALLSEVEREWRAQIENVIAIVDPRPLTALDGHIHVHMVPFLFRLAVKLAREYGIPEIRNVREPFYVSRRVSDCWSRRFAANCVKREVLVRLSGGNAESSEAAGRTSPDRLLGVLYSGMMSRANIAAGIAAARRQGARRIEVVVHIGRAERSELGRWNGSPNRASFVLSPSRDDEFEELKRLRSPRSPDERRRRVA
ncbi:MAG: ChbG/HpnK family deacetylase [Thermoanaerobaculales bacterium]|jgi:predicted glycoside hydrolase/deacetylase ChbG (UPF0249 family)|nr:ChbG/HpnK family deacetylase [Thermoanaerobaculales bacterium]